MSNRKHEDPVANKAYQEFADHYHMAILPARVLAPKDKAAVEGNVGNVISHIIAKLRNVKFFSLVEINNAISELLDRFNAAPFQKRDGSRLSVFQEEEAPFLQPLPVLPYEYARWKQATVQLNYHVSDDSQNYSCPYGYVRKRVDVRTTRSLVEIFYQGKRISSHPRLYGRQGQYATVTEHMPPNHQLYSEWDGNRFRRWASKIGESAFTVVDKLLLKKSSLQNTKASIGDIAYLPERKLDRDLINRLGTCDFIARKRNLLVMGATGAGKTFLASAIATNACRDGWPALYVRLPDFFIEYANAAVNHKEFEILKKYQKVSLLVLDEFLLIPADEAQQRILLELLERRYGRSSTIFCSQFSSEGWHDQLGGSAIADSILDRITPNSYTITIHGDVSMRQRLSEND